MAVPKRKGGSDVGRFLRTPGPTGRANRVIAALAALYVIELVAQALGAPVLELARAPMSGVLSSDLAGSWRAVTAFLISWPDAGGVWNTAMSLVATWFVWPRVDEAFGVRKLAEALAAMVVAGIVLVGLVDALGAYGGLQFGRGLVLGWAPLLTGTFCLLGLLDPASIIRLNFVLPVPMWVFTWGSLALTIILIVANLGTRSDILVPVQMLGIWLGAYGWYRWRGPGGRRRYLKSEAKKIERELTRLRVLPGGRDGTFH